jgi:hypothetical protein
MSSGLKTFGNYGINASSGLSMQKQYCLLHELLLYHFPLNKGPCFGFPAEVNTFYAFFDDNLHDLFNVGYNIGTFIKGFEVAFTFLNMFRKTSGYIDLPLLILNHLHTYCTC